MKRSSETIPKEAQTLDFLGKDFKSTVLNMLNFNNTIKLQQTDSEHSTPKHMGHFFSIDHWLGHKLSVNRLKI